MDHNARVIWPGCIHHRCRIIHITVNESALPEKDPAAANIDFTSALIFSKRKIFHEILYKTTDLSFNSFAQKLMIKCYPPRPRSFEGQKMTNCSTGKEAMRRKSDPSWHHERRSNSQKESYKNKNIGDFCIWSRFLQSWQKCSGNISRMRKVIKGS